MLLANVPMATIISNYLLSDPGERCAGNSQSRYILFHTNGNTGRCSNRKKLGCQSTESAEVTVQNPGTGSPSAESHSLRSRTWRRLGRCCLYAEVAERLLRTSYPGRQLGRTCLLHRSGLPVLYPQYAGIRIRHGKYLRNGGIVAGETTISV